jgi:hypothetical protein
MSAPKGLVALRINKFRAVLVKETVDSFELETFDGAKLMLDIKADDSAIIHSHFQVYGWHPDKRVVLDWKGEVSMYRCDELYDAMRGKKGWWCR